MTNETELMPFPFCGSVDSVHASEECDDTLVTCQDCEASAWLDKWNTRADAQRMPQGGNARSMTRVTVCPGVDVFMTQEQMMTWEEWIRLKQDTHPTPLNEAHPNTHTLKEALETTITHLEGDMDGYVAVLYDHFNTIWEHAANSVVK